MSNFVQALFGNELPNGQIIRFELLQKFDSHTVAIVDLSLPSRLLQTPRAAVYSELTTVFTRWGLSATKQATFFGYVNHQEILGSSGANTTVRYMCVGTSLPMNTTRPRSWKRVTASSIAVQFAKRYRLRALVHRSSTLVNFTVTSQSDFASLQKLAADTGFKSWVDGGTLYFVDPRVRVTWPGSVTPVLNDLTEFHVTNGTLVPRSTGVITNKIAVGRDPYTSRAFEVRSSPVLTIDSKDVTGFRPFLTSVLPGEFTNFADARTQLDVATRNQNWQTAVLAAGATPRARPGVQVEVTDPDVPADQKGFWTVDYARHLMDFGNSVFRTEMEVSRNQGDAPAIIRQTQLVNTPEIVGCVQRDKAFWESETLDVVYLN
jgi:hypothetical protein